MLRVLVNRVNQRDAGSATEKKRSAHGAEADKTKKKKRLAFVIAHLGPGGAQRVAVNAANALADRGFDILRTGRRRPWGAARIQLAPRRQLKGYPPATPYSPRAPARRGFPQSRIATLPSAAPSISTLPNDTGPRLSSDDRR